MTRTITYVVAVAALLCGGVARAQVYGRPPAVRPPEPPKSDSTPAQRAAAARKLLEKHLSKAPEKSLEDQLNARKASDLARLKGTPIVPQRPAPTTKAPTAAATKAAAPAAKTQDKPGTQLKIVNSDTAVPVAILRETFEYQRTGRDPFFSLLSSTELRPGIGDLRLTGILYDHSGRNSRATLRDIASNQLYRVTTGSTLGRMTVTAIHPKVVVFLIREFGTDRRDSLILGDTTKARAK
jgi:hypothetical protein